jgi:hypothetical protein
MVDDEGMRKTFLLLLFLSACAADPPPRDADERSSGPTVYGQISASVDRISTR